MGYTILVSLLSTVAAIAIAVGIVRAVRLAQQRKPSSALSITLECDTRAEEIIAWVHDCEDEGVNLPITAEYGVAEILRWVGAEFGFEVETVSVKKDAVKWVTLHLKGRD